MATRIAIRDEHLAAIGLAASTRRCAKLMGSGKMRLLDTRSHKSVFMPLFWGLFRGRCIRAESPLVQGCVIGEPRTSWFSSSSCSQQGM